ncbi:MAG: mechanosensitive ion channel [Hellea sp.]|mgnify:CR=1 FL=1|jgi:MscS family membrane protein|nr:mechanosensitive ion channel [Hellea sp.]
MKSISSAVITQKREISSFLKFFTRESVVLFVIFLNALIFIALDINPDIVNAYPWLSFVDIVCIIYFIFEALIKIYKYGFKGYLVENWNKFDALIVLSSIPILLEPIIPSISNNLAWTPVLRMVRLFRLAKFLRLGRLVRYAGKGRPLSKIKVPIYFILFIVTANFLFTLVNLPDHISKVINVIYAPLLILGSVAIISKISLIFQDMYINPYFVKEFKDSAEAIINFSRTIFVITLWFCGFIVAIEVAGFNSFSLIAGLGIGSLAVAFAAQDALGNIIAGVSLLAQKNFIIGDYVKLGDNEGKVINLGFRSFDLECRDGSRLSIPNKTINSTTLHNLSKRKELNDTLHFQLSASLTSQELSSSLAIISKTCEDNELIKNHRIKIIEMNLTHTVEVTFYVIIKEVEREYNGIGINDITPRVGSELYMNIFINLEKSDLTPENKILFMQTS